MVSTYCTSYKLHGTNPAMTVCVLAKFAQKRSPVQVSFVIICDVASVAGLWRALRAGPAVLTVIYNNFG